MKLILSIIMILLIALLQIPADEKILTAYKYKSEDIFTATTSDIEAGFRLLDVNNLERSSETNLNNPSNPFLFDDSDIGSKLIFATYVLYGNIKEQVDITFTFTPLSASDGTHTYYYPYSIEVVPERSQLNSSYWPIYADHMYSNGRTYRFKYEENISTNPTSGSIAVSNTNKSIVVSYTPSITITPTLPNKAKYNIIDTWTRHGTIAITLNSNVPANTAPSGTYQATMTIKVESVS